MPVGWWGLGDSNKPPLLPKKFWFCEKKSASLVHDAYDRSLFMMYLLMTSHVQCSWSITWNSVKDCLTPQEKMWLCESFCIPSNLHVFIDWLYSRVYCSNTLQGWKWDVFVLKHLTICFSCTQEFTVCCQIIIASLVMKIHMLLTLRCITNFSRNKSDLIRVETSGGVGGSFPPNTPASPPKNFGLLQTLKWQQSCV